MGDAFATKHAQRASECGGFTSSKLIGSHVLKSEGPPEIKATQTFVKLPLGDDTILQISLWTLALIDYSCMYAIGDIHGRLDLLMEIEERIRADAADHQVGDGAICFLGDYIDRGPDSSAVLSYLAKAPDDGLDRIFLKGNHEQRMIDFMLDPRAGAYWARTGGREALLSFGIELEDDLQNADWKRIRHNLVRQINEQQFRFLFSLDYYFQWREFLFVHAGIRPGLPLEQQDPDDLMNIREPFSSSVIDFGFRIIHGHDSHCEPEIRKNRINIDTKAWATGRLTCAVINETGLSLLSTGH